MQGCDKHTASMLVCAVHSIALMWLHLRHCTDSMLWRVAGLLSELSVYARLVQIAVADKQHTDKQFTEQQDQIEV